MKNKLKDIACIAGILASIIILIWLTGCSTSKVTLPDGTEIIHQPVFQRSAADQIEFYYKSEDPNGPNYTVWVGLNGSKRSVNPGKLSIIEPRTGINATLTAGETE